MVPCKVVRDSEWGPTSRMRKVHPRCRGIRTNYRDPPPSFSQREVRLGSHLAGSLSPSSSLPPLFFASDALPRLHAGVKSEGTIGSYRTCVNHRATPGETGARRLRSWNANDRWGGPACMVARPGLGAGLNLRGDIRGVPWSVTRCGILYYAHGSRRRLAAAPCARKNNNAAPLLAVFRRHDVEEVSTEKHFTQKKKE
jgi:hypothetical protein